MKVSLKNKIIILVVLPCLGLIVLISMFIFKNYSDYSDAIVAVDNVNISTAVSRIVHEIQKERGLSALYLGKKIEINELLKQRENSLNKHSLLTNQISKKKISDDLRKHLDAASESLNNARKNVDSNGSATEVTIFFGKAINEFILSEIYIAQNTNAFGDEKKLLSVSMLDLAKENAGRIRANVLNILNIDHELSLSQVSLLSSLVAGLNENLNSPTLIISNETQMALEKFKESSDWKKSQSVVSFVLDNASKGSFNKDSNVFFKDITSSINNLGEIIFSEQENVKHSIEKKGKSITTDLILIIIINSILFISVLLLSIYFIRSITKPIQFLMEKLNFLSKDVFQSSEKVSQASEQLSQSSVEQAAALQEAVSSLEEITRMISKTSDNSQTSQSVSKDSLEMANNGQIIIGELNISINKIADSNEKIKERVLQSNIELGDISKIISEIGIKTKVINDIVFQTKLLSFNASVEAARAGEQGKGFAVVAEEVGKLAEMSGGAAKEISDVLARSLQLVDSTIENTKKETILTMEQSRCSIEVGLKTSKRCGESLIDIVEKVQEVNKLIIEIAIASSEQSQGMGQISLAMNELDHATHANSTSSVETAKSGQRLKDQAQELNVAVEELGQIVYG